MRSDNVPRYRKNCSSLLGQGAETQVRKRGMGWKGKEIPELKKSASQTFGDANQEREKGGLVRGVGGLDLTKGDDEGRNIDTVQPNRKQEGKRGRRRRFLRLVALVD